jgi:hypothetical protein
MAEEIYALWDDVVYSMPFLYPWPPKETKAMPDVPLYLTAGQLSVKLSEIGPLDVKNMPVLAIDRDGKFLGVLSVGVIEGHAFITLAPYKAWPE